MSDSVKIIRRGITRQVVTKIPEQEVTEEIEVDTLQEFLKEMGLTEDQVRIACKEHKEDKVTQPTYKMDDLLKVIDEGKLRAQKYLTSDFKETKIVTSDMYAVSALIDSKKWQCVNKDSKKQYTLERI